MDGTEKAFLTGFMILCVAVVMCTAITNMVEYASLETATSRGYSQQWDASSKQLIWVKGDN